MADNSTVNRNPWDEIAPQAGYQSLSLLSVGSMVVGGIFGIFVVVGSLVAFMGTSPFLLPIWAIVFPTVSLLLGWMALAQIRDSAGVLTGRKFAWTGINVSLVISLLYFTYFMANNLAVRQQASEFAQLYFKAVAEGPPEKAFLFTLPPGQRPKTSEASRIRAFVESTYNVTQDPSQPGAFTRYQIEPYYRVLSNSGGKFEATLLRANLPDYGEGGYIVPVTYQIKTDIIEMIVDFQVQSASGGQGREWYLKPVGVTTAKMKLLPEGERLELQANAATTTASNFARALTKVKPGSPTAEPDFNAAFLMSVPGKAFADAKTPEALTAMKKARDTFFGPVDETPGRFVPNPGDKFYCDSTIKTQLLAELSKALTPGSGYHPYVANWISPSSNPPRITEKDGVSRFEAEANFQFVPRTVMSGRLILESTKGSAPEDPASWRVLSFELIRGKVVTNSPEGKR